jgi:regulatory protein
MDHKITALRVQKHNPNRINVFLDGEFAFGVSRIVGAWLSIGQLLGDAEIQNLEHQDSLEVALQKALLVLSYRPRSEQEVRKKLGDDGYEEQTIAVTIERLKANGLLEDRSFARTWVESRTVFHPRSRRLMALELRQKGVSDEVIQETLADAVQDETLAYEAARVHARKLAGLTWVDFRKKLNGFLARRGFGFETADVAVRRVWADLEDGGEHEKTGDEDDLT